MRNLWAGSSPLARGLLKVHPQQYLHVGIIPARAGFTARSARHFISAEDHPRSRGVYIPPGLDCSGLVGSSPLARGLHRAAARLLLAPGIIPARAGFTRVQGCPSARRRDHPRSRGVYVRGRGSPVGGRGSSPLARGLPGLAVGDRAAVGIIPARAGFTQRGVQNLAGAPDHPRSRGVYGAEAPAPFQTSGSSPLARGLRKALVAIVVPVRIIPARAGFTVIGPTRTRRPTDHPRSRGVYPLPTRPPSESAGSSPLARGLRAIPKPCLFRHMDHPRSRGVYLLWRVY